MKDFLAERAAFGIKQREQARLADERASCLLVAGLDLDRVLALSPKDRREAYMNLRRLLERERLKGANRHWGYDLNRHIALKRALDRISASIGDPAGKQLIAQASSRAND